MNTDFEVEKVNSHFLIGKPLIFEESSFSGESFDFLISIFKTILQKLGREDLWEPLKYVINEMVTNAEKANIKRSYFKEKRLNIRHPEEYEKGMKLFSQLNNASRNSLRDKLAEGGFYARISFQLEDRTLVVTTVNNSMPNNEEVARIDSRIALTETVKDIPEAYMSVLDDSEGAGLGIVTTILMLRSLGIHKNPYRFVPLPASGESSAEVRIPLNALSDSHIGMISEEIAKEIKLIPKLPENVIEIQRMLSNPEKMLPEIADLIARDPALTAELLRLVNSAQYMLPQKITSIQKAVVLIGASGLRNLMYVYGAQNIINGRYKDLNTLWDHAYRCAFYSAELARRFKCVESADDVYVGGILHDIGRIILMDLHGDVLDKISLHCRNNSIPGDFMETLALGIGHAKTGAMIARRWNLPEALVCPIEHHHQPFLAPETYRNHVYVIHFADLLATGHDHGGIEFNTVGQDVASFFDIKDEGEFNTLSQMLASKLAE
ncbi:MAG: HDOD domain-containing protein [Deltaproteobacteria bacterium]|nr:HDOD domain-containing protein [Deltaproteobacteria bacterium]